MKRPYITGAMIISLTFGNAAQGVAKETCRPELAVSNVRFSAWQPPTMERVWTAVVTIDATRCQANSAGHFEISFRRMKEIGPELEFAERFTWTPPSVTVSVTFWADEAVERYRASNVSPCICAN